MSKLVELTRKPLSDTDILKRLHGKTKVLVYSDFQEYDDLDSLLAPYGNVVFLLKMMPNYGHWMCIKRTGDRISFFDSYGEFPDKQKKHVPKGFLKESGQSYNKLCELLLKGSYKYTIEFSEYKYQKKDGKTATCGQWCCVFIESGLTTDDFRQFIDSFPEKDKDLICAKLFYGSKS